MRLTYKNEEDKKYYPDMNVCSQFKGNYREEIHKKLGQLEDIEEEYGIDLITLFKALKDGFYFKQANIIIHISKDDLFLNSGALYFRSGGLIFAGLLLPFKDYGKTWALTKEELL